MSEILAIAESVWRRILTMKAVYFLVICAVIQTSVTLLYKYLVAGEHQKLMVDVSQLLTTLAGLLCVLALAFDIPRELREGSAENILSKPLGRSQYLLGKYLGIVWVGLVVTGLISGGFCFVHNLAFEGIPDAAIKGHILTVAMVIPMAALALFFASILGEAAAAILTVFSVWVLHSVPLLKSAFIVYGGLLPDMNLFNLRAEASYSLPIEWTYVLLAVVWGIVYSVGLLALSAFIFNRRDLK